MLNRFVSRSAAIFSVTLLLTTAVQADSLKHRALAVTSHNAQSSSVASTTSAAIATQSTPTPAVAASSVSSASDSALTLQQRIARLPPLRDTGINVTHQSDGIREHLNSVLRFYRDATHQEQKTGEPSDILYTEQLKTQASSIAHLAFASARNTAALLERVDSNAVVSTSSAPTVSVSEEAKRLTASQARVQSRMAELQTQQAAIAQQLLHAKPKDRPALLQKQEQIDGGLDLEQATLQALGNIDRFSETQQGHSGLAGDIDRLEASAPELADASSKPVTSAPLVNLSDIQHAGLVTQASALFDLMFTRRAIDDQIAEIDRLHDQATKLRSPIVKVLRSTVQQGEKLAHQNVDLSATPTTDAQDLAATRKQFDDLKQVFEVLAASTLPLSQETVLLDAARGTLSSWRVTVDAEYRTMLRALLMRCGLIGLALLILGIIGRVWGHASLHYVQDLRRRRQLLVVRRVVMGFLCVLVVLFGFVTQFSSLATFAGFISAGIAVGLQTILLSVAAYFFIIGRYGVRVGDRITVAGVTGTVIEVGIARFYLMELVGTGNELHSTGRVAVFANSVLFQTGTPLYKQLPGTEYAWHELTAKLTEAADPDAVSKELCQIVQQVYETYKSVIDAQQRQIEGWLGAAVDAPRVEAHLRLTDAGMQVAVLFPVNIEDATHADARIATSILKAVREDKADGPLKVGLDGTPIIKAAIKS
ncbi:MAG: mechanosensitive ion channel [Acidobacteriaceae bacterium]|nr:mechanosensitive ion channel [Acidobacteriaceae bacterium]